MTTSPPPGAFAHLPRARTVDNARAWALAYLAHLQDVPPAEIDLSLSAAAHGLDSVDAVVMAAALEEHFGVEVDAGLFLREAPLADLIAALRGEPLWQEAGAQGA